MRTLNSRVLIKFNYTHFQIDGVNTSQLQRPPESGTQSDRKFRGEVLWGIGARVRYGSLNLFIFYYFYLHTHTRSDLFSAAIGLTGIGLVVLLEWGKK